MRDTDLLLALVAASPNAGDLVTQANPAFGAVFADLYASETDPGMAIDHDVRALVATSDVTVHLIDGNPEARALRVTNAGRHRAAVVLAAIASTDPTPLG